MVRIVARRVGAWALVLGVGFACVGQTSAPSATRRVGRDPTVPQQKKGEQFAAMHEGFLKRAKEGNVDLLFLGDSITMRWGTDGKGVWEKNYGKLNAANFGIGGDKIEHVLWRVENGELEGISPKVVVVMLGTNNTGLNTAEEIARGDENLVRVIREKLPESKILLLGIFPRGQRRTEGEPDRMEIIRTVNARLSKLEDGKAVRYLDIGEKFLVDGKIPREVMKDQLHPTEKGYEIWAGAMGPLLGEMMK